MTMNNEATQHCDIMFGPPAPQPTPLPKPQGPRPTQAQPVCPPPPPPPIKQLPPPQPLDVGYIEGITGSAGIYGWGGTIGSEAVFDLYDFEFVAFNYYGPGIFMMTRLGISWGTYAAVVTGWSSPNFTDRGVHNYGGPFEAGALNFPIKKIPVKLPYGVGLGGTLQGFNSPDWSMYGAAFGLSIGVDLQSSSIVQLTYTTTQYDMIEATRVRYNNYDSGGSSPTFTDAVKFSAFITAYSAAKGALTLGFDPYIAGRAFAIPIVLYNGKVWDDLGE